MHDPEPEGREDSKVYEDLNAVESADDCDRSAGTGEQRNPTVVWMMHLLLLWQVSQP